MINVASVVTDPRFTEAVTRIQRTETINSYGESVVTTLNSTIQAVVTSPGKTGVMRLDDAQTYQDSIQVTTASPLSGPAIGYQPDQIVWRGQTYVVVITNDYQAFGYTRATCKLVDLQDQSHG